MNDFTQLHCPMTYTVYKFQPEFGDFSACCDAKSIHFNIDLFNKLNVNYFTHHPRLVERKQNLYDNIKNDDCSGCWIKEDLGLDSMRKTQGVWTELYGNRNLDIYSAYTERIELWMNSTCNLGCFMCHLGNSNTLRKIWHNDPDTRGRVGKEVDKWIDNYEYNSLYKPLFIQYMKYFIRDSLIKDTRSNNLLISYLGGEPTLHDEMYEHADEFIEYSKQAIARGKFLKIEIVTNGSSKPRVNERVLQMFQKYKNAGWSTRIMLSQDATDQHSQVRFNADFDLIKSNFQSWIQDDRVDEITSFTVLSNLNLPYIDKLANYFYDSIKLNQNRKKINIHFNTLIDPKWMRVNYLPKKYAVESIKNTLNTLEKINQLDSRVWINYQLLNSVASTLTENVSQSDVEFIFKNYKYVESVYKKTYPEFSFKQTFPHLLTFAEQYGIDI